MDYPVIEADRPMNIDSIAPNAQFTPSGNRALPQLGLFPTSAFSLLGAPFAGDIPATNNVGVPHATFTVESTLAEGESADSTIPGDVLFLIDPQASEGMQKYTAVTVFECNRRLREEHRKYCDIIPGIHHDDLKSTIEDSFTDEGYSNKQGSTRKRKHDIDYDLFSGIMKSTVKSVEVFASFAIYAGVKLHPETQQVQNANNVGEKIGLVSHVLQACGDAKMPNWWGAVNVGDSIGFIAKPVNPTRLTQVRDVGIVSDLGPVQLYPVIAFGEGAIHGRRMGCSTVTHSKANPYPKDYELYKQMDMTFAERCIDTTSFDPFDYDAAYVDHMLVPVIGHTKRQHIYYIPRIKKGIYYHVGTVHRKDDPDPKLSDIKTAFLGPNEKEAMDAQNRIANNHRITVMVTGGKRPFLADNTFQAGGFM